MNTSDRKSREGGNELPQQSKNAKVTGHEGNDKLVRYAFDNGVNNPTTLFVAYSRLLHYCLLRVFHYRQHSLVLDLCNCISGLDI